MHRLIIKTKSKKYSVFVGNNSLQEFNNVISEFNSKILFLIDYNVHNKCSETVKKIVTNSGNHHQIIVHCSEKNKSLQTVLKILKYLSDNKFDRDSVLVSIGGGVLEDITGFTASIYLRGIKYYQIPTTILSSVDSSVGGKTGVNFNGIKNQIGTFYQPDGVFIDTEFFNTLPKREVVSGIGELTKYAILVPDYYDFFLEEIKKIYQKKFFSEEVIITSLKIKSGIICQDEKEESGLRKILNLGHTFGHGFESASVYKLKHGEAVLCGIFCAILLSERLRLIKPDYRKKIFNDFSFIPINKNIKAIDTNTVIEFMKSDKKNSNRFIRFVIPSKNSIIIDLPVNEKIIFQVIERLKKIIEDI